jgi:hypothetical protein
VRRGGVLSRERSTPGRVLLPRVEGAAVAGRLARCCRRPGCERDPGPSRHARDGRAASARARRSHLGSVRRYCLGASATRGVAPVEHVALPFACQEQPAAGAAECCNAREAVVGSCDRSLLPVPHCIREAQDNYDRCASSEQTCGRARLLAVSFSHHDRAAAQHQPRRPGAARAARGAVVGLPLAGRPFQTAF